MAQRPNIPKFGNWESEDNVPYTVYFDKARKGKTGGKMINPNDPQENPDMFPNITPAAQAPASSRTTEPEEPIGQRAVRPTQEHRVSREDSDHGQSIESSPHHDNVGRRASGGSPYQRRGGHGSGSGRPARHSAGFEYSIERSPLHPQQQAKRGSGNPASEGKNSYDSSHGTPGRRMKPTGRGDESPDKGAAVPRFGEWDESNPSSADNYTHIFNKVRVEKQTGSPMVSGMDTELSYMNRPKQNNHDSAKGCCFPWSRK